ncbi:MAG: hypothetical protein QOH44_692 [Actinomycetota bacterium]|nr:hypothetical protein [Actinomycetota bacterium]
MRDSRLLVDLAERLEAVPRIERSDVFLCVQHERFATVPLDHGCHELLRESVAAAIRANDDPSDNAPGVAVFGGLIEKGTKIGGDARVICDPVVLGRRLAVAEVELGFIDPLLEKEHVGPKFQDAVELVGCEFTPLHGHRGTFGHASEFNREQ